MEKDVALLMPGQGEERTIHDIPLAPGTTVLEAIRQTGIENPNHFLVEDREGQKFVGGENFYNRAVAGQKYFIVPDEARVGDR